MRIILLLCLISSINMVYAKSQLHTDLPLKYLVRAPAVTKNKPLIIFIHGYGTNEEDLFKMNKEFHPDYVYLSVRAPMSSPYGGAYQWFNLNPGNGGLMSIAREIQSSSKTLLRFIKAATQKYETYADNVLLVGFSQGAIMSYEVALKNPTTVRGIVVLSGAMLPTISSELTQGHDLKNLAVFIGHGTEDDRVPYSAGLAANEALKKTTIKPEFHSYQGLHHSINQTELTDINNWIKKTLSTPRRLNERTINL